MRLALIIPACVLAVWLFAWCLCRIAARSDAQAAAAFEEHARRLAAYEPNEKEE